MLSTVQNLSGGKSEIKINKHGQKVKRTRESSLDRNNHAAYIEVNKATGHTALHMVQTHEPVCSGNHSHSGEKPVGYAKWSVPQGKK